MKIKILILFLFWGTLVSGQDDDFNTLSFSFHTTNIYFASVDTFDIESGRFFIKEGTTLKVCPLDLTICDTYHLNYTGAKDVNEGLIFEIKETPLYNWTINPAKGVAILYSRTKQIIYY